MAIQYSSTANFKTKLFNITVNKYFDTVFKELVAKYLLTSAKGGSGYGFEDFAKLQESIIESDDMPYHIHILNGIIPALKFYELQLVREGTIDREDVPLLLKALLVGFTFHDLNKLTGKSLELGIQEDLSRICDDLKVEVFFKEWKEWKNELGFIILKTEKRTSGYALNFDDLKDSYIGQTIDEISRLADVFASQSSFDDVADFYQSICKIKYKFERLDSVMDLSYITVSPNIYTLLSQKLLQAAQTYIIGNRNEDILFHLRNGFVYIGKALSKEEQEVIIDGFINDDSTFSIESLVQINSRRSCQFGFVSYRKLTPDILERVLEVGFTKKSQINFFEILVDANSPNKKGFNVIEELIDNYELPFEMVLPKKDQKKPMAQQKYTFPITNNAWLDSANNELFRLFGLIRIKYILQNKPGVNVWKSELEIVWKDCKILDKEKLSYFTNPYTKATIAALLKTIEYSENGEDFEELITIHKNEICKEFEKDTSSRIEGEMKWFCSTFLDGNFEKDFIEMMRSFEIPTKKEMCVFTGGKAYSKYEDAKTHGVAALGFNNRTFNKLSSKAKQHKVSDLFSAELEVRNYLQNNSSYTSCVYFDFGEYVVHLNKDNAKAVLNRISQSTTATYNAEKLQVEVTNAKSKLDFNLYNVSYRSIEYNIDGNVSFVLDSLRIIEQTGLRIFTSGIISPYISHKEIFVFENCLPIVKKLGWDKIRIDEIKVRIQEIELLQSLSEGKTKQIVSTALLLEYSQNVRAVFSAYAQLDDKNANKALKILNDSIHILTRFRNYNMSTMKQLAEIARQMIRPKGSSASQSSRIIRDSIDIIKKLYKEGKTNAEDRETYVGQICGAMEQILRTNQGDSSFVQPFAENVYDELFINEWKMKIPDSNRLRDWINEFAYWYKEEDKKDSARINEIVVKNAIKEVQLIGIEADEAAVITWLKENKNENRAIDTYENQYRIAYQTIISKP